MSSATMRQAGPWDALLLTKPAKRPAAAVGSDPRPETKLAKLLAELGSRGSATTLTLAVCAELDTRQVWGLLKGPRSVGQVAFHDSRWSMVPGFAGRDIERAAALLRKAGWLVHPPS